MVETFKYLFYFSFLFLFFLVLVLVLVWNTKLLAVRNFNIAFTFTVLSNGLLKLEK